MSEDSPELTWIAGRPDREWLIVCGVVILIAIGFFRAERARDQARPGKHGFPIFVAEMIFDPIAWAGLACWIAGATLAARPTSFKCPHCAHVEAASDNLKKGSLRSRWACPKCKNLFTKGSAPPPDPA